MNPTAPTDISLAGGDVLVNSNIVDNLTFVTARVNGTGPYTFILDTGASIASVSPRIADLFSDQIMGQTDVSSGSGTSINALIHIDSISVGDVDFRNFQAVVINFDALSKSIGVTLDGIVANALFSRLTLTLDYDARTVRFHQAPVSAADNCTVLPISSSSAGLPLLSVSAAGRPATVLIDSGNDHIFTFPSPFKDLEFSSPPTPGAAATVTGTGPSLIGCMTGAVTFGCISIDQPCISVSGNAGGMGGEALRKFIVSIDQQSGRVSFRQP